ncbi:hypothetical protein M9H77_31102 [Catharanthus roseus]|uniref:Uncharacterized protein n=1 Tax=Catharanthus roseus TaxID=4058 RepID=A0ACC0A0Y7_CATRO|nr:hypothetical protein M9H77_31102 [Catharanthus roseus]
MPKCLGFPWDRRVRLLIDDSILPMTEAPLEAEDQQSCQGNNQEDSTIEEHSKNSLPDTPYANIQNSPGPKKILKISLEAGSNDPERSRHPNKGMSLNVEQEERTIKLPDKSVAGEQKKNVPENSVKLHGFAEKIFETSGRGSKMSFETFG